MQGSTRENDIVDQEYRTTIGRVIRERYPDAEIIDPLALFPDSVEYDDDRARQVLFEMAEEAGRADVLVVYLPEASMGTAMEMVRAYDAGTTVVTVSPMAANWVIRSLSRVVLPTLEAFQEWVEGGELERIADA
jgi:hypothetical protein